MRKIATVITLGISLIVSGCASNGGFATVDNGGCDTGMSSGLGALLGAAAGYAISKENDNSSAQNNRAILAGAAAGGLLAAGICLAINTKTVQKKSALTVENQYKSKNGGSLPSQTKVAQYTTILGSGNTVSVNNDVVVKSDLTVIKGKNDPLKILKETLVLKDGNGKVLKTVTKNVTQSGSYDSGEFENSFSWKFPPNVSKGKYIVETELWLNGNKVGSNSKTFTLV